jgi:uncharacterized protein (DUF362 family)
MKISRRKFMLLSSVIGAGAVFSGVYTSIRLRKSISPLQSVEDKSKVYIINVKDRNEGVKTLLEHFPNDLFTGESIAIKANYNSADPFPGTTHIETLAAVLEYLKEDVVKKVTLAERSGVGNTRKNLEESGVFDLAKKYDVKVVVLDEIDTGGWAPISAEGTHWLRGFHLARLFLDSSRIIQICCLKTHRFGGHFTMSLKNSVGLVAKRLPSSLYDFMVELHTSPFQRSMIAEINRFYNVDLVIMDAMKAFISGGPDRGTVVEPGVMLASKDRVALDAVGVAILRLYGSTKEVMKGRIFDLDQIKRAAELGIGVRSADLIELIPANEISQEITDKIEGILQAQG